MGPFIVYIIDHSDRLMDDLRDDRNVSYPEVSMNGKVLLRPPAFIILALSFALVPASAQDELTVSDFKPQSRLREPGTATRI